MKISNNILLNPRKLPSPKVDKPNFMYFPVYKLQTQGNLKFVLFKPQISKEMCLAPKIYVLKISVMNEGIISCNFKY